MKPQKTAIIMILSLLTFSVFIFPVNKASKALDFPPPDFSSWPEPEFNIVMGVDNSEFKVRNYYRKNMIRQEIDREQGTDIRVYHFKEDEIDRFVLQAGDENYHHDVLSYEEFQERDRYHLGFIYRALPGEELGLPYRFDGLSTYLGRKVERWKIKGRKDGQNIELIDLVDPLLRLVLQSRLNDQILYQVTEVEIKEQADELFEISD